jgi:hypothetical protein
MSKRNPQTTPVILNAVKNPNGPSLAKWWGCFGGYFGNLSTGSQHDICSGQRPNTLKPPHNPWEPLSDSF